MRKQLHTVHKWLGAALLLFFVLQAITGLLLTYRDDIISVFDKAYEAAASEDREVAPQDVTLEALYDAAQREYPRWTVRRIDYPKDGSEPYLARLRGGAGDEKIVRILPHTLEVYPEPAVSSFMRFLFDLHVYLLAGDAGKNFVGAVGVVSLVLVITGAIISLKGVKRWRKLVTVTFKNTIRTLFELHRAVGLVMLLVVFVLSLTGVGLVFGGPLKQLFGEGASAAVAIDAGEQVLSSDLLLEWARAEMPSATVKNVRLKNDGVLHRVVFHKGDPGVLAPSSQVWLNPSSGEIVAIKDASNLSPVDFILSWMYPLHVDLGIGPVGRLINFLGGVALLLLAITGPWLWWKRHKVRRRRPRRAKG